MDFLETRGILKTDLPGLIDEASVWASRFGNLMLDHLPLRKYEAVLDVGCGVGYPTLELADMLGNNVQITGLDLWDEALERAIWKAEKRGLQQVEFVRGDAAKTTFAASSFDLITCNLGINNVAAPHLVLKELRRLVKPDGVFGFTTNPVGHLAEFYGWFRDVLADLGLSDKPLQANEQHRLSEMELTHLLARHGFQVTRTVRDSFQFRTLDGEAFMQRFLVQIGFMDGWRDCVPEDQWEAVRNALVVRLNDEAETQGSLSMSVPMLYMEAVPS